MAEEEPNTQSKSFRLEAIYFLQVNINQGKDLIAADFGGKSDPYVIVTAADRQYTTKVHEKTLNPVWKESTSFSFLSKIDKLRFEVYDKDKQPLGKDDPLGDCELDVTTFYNQGHNGFNGWIDLQNG